MPNIYWERSNGRELRILFVQLEFFPPRLASQFVSIHHVVPIYLCQCVYTYNHPIQSGRCLLIAHACKRHHIYGINTVHMITTYQVVCCV